MAAAVRMRGVVGVAAVLAAVGTVRAAGVDAVGEELLVFLKPGESAGRFAGDHGLTLVSTLRSDPNGHVFALPGGGRAADRLEVVRGAAGVVRATPNRRAVRMEPMSFVPDDPLFFASSSVFNGYAGQWYLNNASAPGRDVRILGAWAQGYTGAGVVVGVVDDSVDIFHPDLAPNASLEHSYDFGQNDFDPTGVNTSDRHGTSVAGIVAARGGNGIGMSGGSPHASLAGLRVDFPNQTVAMFVDATRYRSSGAEAFIQVKNHSYGVNEPFAPTPEDVIALADSAAAGTIHTFSAGNNRGQAGQDSNKKDLQKSPDSITVAALGSSGVFATYSNFGACVFVTAPSSSNRQGEVRSPSTDREGSLGYNQTNADSDPMPALEYTSSFGGTSASAPVVAGVMGLLKQANPAANTRFAKHLLARTSDVVDVADNTTNSDGGWRTNAAGFRFNQNYGFGLVDAAELVSLAPRYLGVTPLVTLETGEQIVQEAIPDNSAVGLTRQVVVSAADLAPLEEVLVSLRVTHAYRGDLEAYLTSPSGYASRVFIRSASDGGDNIDWTFTMNSFWGESAAGTWSLRLADVAGNSAGTWESFSLQFRTGTLLTIAVPEPSAVAWLIPAGALLVRRARRVP